MAWRVWLSGSIPTDLHEEGLRRDSVQTYLTEVLKGLVRAGAHIVHGAHPTVVDTLDAAGLPDGSATLLLSVPHARAAEPGFDVDRYQKAHPYATVVPFGDGMDGPEAAQATLDRLREAAAQQSDALVSFGGMVHRHPDGSRWSGVGVEEGLADQAGRPVYRLVSVPGWASDAPPLPSDNGLAPHERSELAMTTDPATAVRLISLGMARRMVRQRPAMRDRRRAPRGAIRVAFDGVQGAPIPHIEAIAGVADDALGALTEVAVVEGLRQTGVRSGGPTHMALPEEVRVGGDSGPDDVLELTWAEPDGSGAWVEWISAAEIAARAQRDDAGPVVLSGRRVAAGPDAERGLFSWVLKAIRHLRLRGADGDGEGALPATDALARSLAAKLESRHGIKPGLYVFPDPPVQPPVERPTFDTEGGGRWVVFIHGTGSSTVGAFGGLAGMEVMEQIDTLATGADGVLTFEHRTLTQSPIDNALALAQALPHGARLRLITHSRGGLVGELLCWQPPDSLDGLAPDGRAGPLVELARTIQAKELVVERFVRVACPTSGTTLASDRLDLLLSALFNVASLASMPAFLSVPLAVFKEFVGAMVAARADPRALPGLEAMIPESWFPTFLATQAPRPTCQDLLVVAGDNRGGTWHRFRAVLFDLFFWRANDFVVDTQAMLGGLRRKTALVIEDYSKETHHLNYFMRPDVVDAIAEYLATGRCAVARNVPMAEAALRAPRPSNGVRWMGPGGVHDRVLDVSVSAEPPAEAHELVLLAGRPSSWPSWVGSSLLQRAVQEETLGLAPRSVGEVRTVSTEERVVLWAGVGDGGGRSWDVECAVERMGLELCASHDGPVRVVVPVQTWCDAGCHLTANDLLEAVTLGVLGANRRSFGAKLNSSIQGVEFIVEHGAGPVRQALQDSLDRLGMRGERVEVHGEFGGGPGAAQGHTVTRRLQLRSQEQGLDWEYSGGRGRVCGGRLRVQSLVVEGLMRKAIEEGDRTTARSLYHLLTPRDLLEARRANTALVVDIPAARIPWELLEPFEDRDRLPAGVRFSLTRQLAVRMADVVVEAPESNSILVIGEPAGVHPPLPGARGEAVALAQHFRDQGWVVRQSIGETGHQVVNALLQGRPEIVHIAAHGEFDDGDPSKTGVLLEGDWRLTASEFGAMQAVPRLVFVNCCHLGRMRSDLVDGRFGASLAEELLARGVDVLVATGWPVGDLAAVVFARTFYASLVEHGQPLGVAVTEARRATYRAHPYGTTWGAYQVYGDAGFRW